MRTGQGLRLREPHSPEYSCAAWNFTYTGYERGKRFSYWIGDLGFGLMGIILYYLVKVKWLKTKVFSGNQAFYEIWSGRLFLGRPVVFESLENLIQYWNGLEN